MGATETRKDELLAARDALAPDVQRVRSAEKELAFAEEWSRTKGRELEVLLAVSKALPADEAYLTQLRWDGEPLRLNGRAKDLGAVSRFINALGQDPRIERTSFETARERTGRDAIGLDFTASARLIPVGGAQ